MDAAKGEKRNIRLLMLATDNHPTSGAFLSMVKMCEILRDEHGADVHVVVPSHGPGERLLSEAGIPFTMIRSYPWVCNCGAVGFVERLAKLILLPFLNAGAVRRIAHLLKTGGFDLLHINTSYSGVGAAAAMRAGVPAIWHIRELIREGQGKCFCSQRATLRSMASATCVIAISQAVKAEYAGRLGLKNVKVIMNGIDEHTFPERKDGKTSNSPVQIFYGGGYDPRKGFSNVIAAATNLKRRGRMFRLILAGELPDHVRTEIKRTGLESETDELGMLGLDEMADWLRRVDVSCVSSQNEAFGRKTVEAMMSGALVIATESGGTPELIANGETGLLYKPGDVAGLTECLERLFSEPEAMRTIARKGCKFAHERLTATANADAVFALYNAILERRDGRGMKPTAVVIPVYGRDDALATVPFLLAQRYADALRIVVVDNGNDATRSAKLKTLANKRVEVISFNENRGGSAAYIAGVETIRRKFPECRYVWLLDDDAKPNANTLPALVETMDRLVDENPRTASVGSTVISTKDADRIVECGASFSTLLGHAFPKLAGQRLSDAGNRILPVDYAAACSLLVNMAAVEECGFWEDLFIHFDDIEWGLRVTKAGWRNYATTASTVVHPEFDPEKAGAWVCYFDARNMYWLAAKHGRLAVWCAWLKNGLKDARARLLHWHPERIPYRRLAHNDFLNGVRRTRTDVVHAVSTGESNK